MQPIARLTQIAMLIVFILHALTGDVGVLLDVGNIPYDAVVLPTTHAVVHADDVHCLPCRLTGRVGIMLNGGNIVYDADAVRSAVHADGCNNNNSVSSCSLSNTLARAADLSSAADGTGSVLTPLPLSAAATVSAVRSGSSTLYAARQAANALHSTSTAASAAVNMTLLPAGDVTAPLSGRVPVSRPSQFESHRGNPGGTSQQKVFPCTFKPSSHYVEVSHQTGRPFVQQESGFRAAQAATVPFVQQRTSARAVPAPSALAVHQHPKAVTDDSAGGDSSAADSAADDSDFDDALQALQELEALEAPAELSRHSRHGRHSRQSTAQHSRPQHKTVNDRSPCPPTAAAHTSSAAGHLWSTQSVTSDLLTHSGRGDVRNTTRPDGTLRRLWVPPQADVAAPMAATPFKIMKRPSIAKHEPVSAASNSVPVPEQTRSVPPGLTSSLHSLAARSWDPEVCPSDASPKLHTGRLGTADHAGSRVQSLMQSPEDSLVVEMQVPQLMSKVPGLGEVSATLALQVSFYFLLS